MSYIKIALESRGLDEYDYPICEVCNKANAVDCDHIEGRGGKHNVDSRLKDPYNLILVCRQCHSRKTARDIPVRKEIVRSILEGKQK